MPWRSIRSRRGGLCALLVVINCFVGAFALGVSPAHAGKISFGTHDTLKRIQDVAIKGPNGEEVLSKGKLNDLIQPNDVIRVKESIF